jgi:hypothetical protein
MKVRRFTKAPTHRGGKCRENVRIVTILRTAILRAPDRDDCVYYNGECMMRAAKARLDQVCVPGCERYTVASNKQRA